MLVIGSTEMEVLEHLWEAGSSSVMDAHSQFGVARNITPTTVQSAFKRLWDKGLLTRTKQSHAYIYTACVGRHQLIELMVEQLLEQFAGSEKEVTIEAFIHVGAVVKRGRDA